MLTSVILPWIHYFAVLTMVGAVFAKLYLMKLPPSGEQIRGLGRADILDGSSAAMVFITGLLRMYHGGKGADWYWHNGLMHGVITAFVLAAGISLIPTIRILRWKAAFNSRNALPDAAELRKARIFLHPQLTLIVIIALLITMVAKGYGAPAQ
jgi:putative membrane protein